MSRSRMFVRIQTNDHMNPLGTIAIPVVVVSIPQQQTSLAVEPLVFNMEAVKGPISVVQCIMTSTFMLRAAAQILTNQSGHLHCCLTAAALRRLARG